MTLEEKVEYWLNIAKYDLETSEVHSGDFLSDFIQKEIIAGGIEIPIPKGASDARR